MEAVTHHGRRTAYRESDRGGDGTPLLCVHGSGGDSRVWKSQFRLSDERPVIAVDLSGHGESEDVDASPGFATLSAYTDDVLAVAEATGARTFAGSSMGGAVLLHAAVERSEFTPDGLVLAGTGPRLPVLEDLLEWLDDDFDRAVEFLTGPRRLLEDPDERHTETNEATMRNCGQAVVRRDFRTCHEYDLGDRLGEVDAPALAIHGEHDRLTPPRYHEELAEGLPDCEYAVVEEAGHLVMLERPEAFNERVGEFLASID